MRGYEDEKDAAGVVVVVVIVVVVSVTVPARYLHPTWTGLALNVDRTCTVPVFVVVVIVPAVVTGHRRKGEVHGQRCRA